ncbi:MAG: phosphoribosylanthranilate isomerase [Candidatus Omnitrophica bacterium]|nr:phosphoribosylanthranilate isomerase [Candidatus Omnitrophota bacterium]MBU1128642.1 phosphoribosylanthranilate isomerase [Candidatus Omnitrophota bacterium]MBU1785023.1 phosphoribosylanthranilate isomerase [Candidatus Omnitrophota bacterium]MBU1852228.1 phosphoribosylanthranilate isomerase [Candidatus Omnitrophota bacterium]
MTKVKICGLTNAEDALLARAYGADLVGFLFADESPRFIVPGEVKKIVQVLPADVGKVGLFKDHTLEEVKENVKLCLLDHVQLHGDESPEFCRRLRKILKASGSDVKIIKTFKVKDRIMGIPPDEYDDADYYLFDTYHPKMMGGTGIRFDWDVLGEVEGGKPFFIAGGLKPENVADAIRVLSPYGVDAASGVERSVGKKDKDKIKEFILNAKNAKST